MGDMSAILDDLGGPSVQSSKVGGGNDKEAEDVMGNPNALAAALAAQANKLKPAASSTASTSQSAAPVSSSAQSDADVMGNPDALAAALAAQANKLKPAGGSEAKPLPPKRAEDMSFAE